MRGHCYDALVGLAGCDKSLPGMMMAMLRLNVPAVFMYGGSILPGRFKGKDVTVVDVFEARRQAFRRQDVGRGPARARVRRLSRRRRLRRPVHRQHHGLRLGGDRPGAAGLGRRAGALREPRRLRAGERQGGDAAARRRHPPARHLHAQGVRERRHRGRGHRRLDQRRRCTCRRWRTSAASSSTCSTSPRSSSARPTSPT